jgi:hypothetical protein
VQSFSQTVLGWFVLREIYASIPGVCIRIVRWRGRRISDATARKEVVDGLVADIRCEESRIRMFVMMFGFLRQTWRDDFPTLEGKDDPADDGPGDST